MGQFSVAILAAAASILSGNQHMWSQFCAALALQLSAPPLAADAVTASAAPAAVMAGAATPPDANSSATSISTGPKRRSGWRSWFAPQPEMFRAELERNGSRVVLSCPPAQAGLCLAWLDRHLQEEKS